MQVLGKVKEGNTCFQVLLRNRVGASSDHRCRRVGNLRVSKVTSTPSIEAGGDPGGRRTDNSRNLSPGTGFFPGR